MCSCDDGLGLIEIVVSLLLLAVISLAVVPLMMQGLTQSARMTTLATANQLAGTQMESVRSAPPACGASAITSTVATVTDARRVPLAVARRIGTCPSALPGTFRVDITVTRTDTGASLSTATTLVYVS